VKSVESTMYLQRQSVRVVAIGLILVGIAFGCVHSKGLSHQILVALYYGLTVAGYFIGTQFNASVEIATGPIKKHHKVVEFMFTLAISFAIHRWLFWG